MTVSARERLTTPILLGAVEQVIGMPFFSDPNLNRMAYENPATLPEAELRPRIPLWIAGLRIVAKTGRVTLGNDLEKAGQVRTEHAVAIGAIRGELMTLDPGLETDDVRLIKVALQAIENKTVPRRRKRVHHDVSEPDVLPSHLIPVGVLDTYIGKTRNSALQALRRREQPLVMLRLPGSTSKEACCSWKSMRLIEEAFGAKKPINIDYDSLPSGPDDTDPLKIACAWDLQRSLVPPHKLVNVPMLGDAALLGQVQTARPYHISSKKLEKLMGGGSKFADHIGKEQGWFQYMRRPDGGYANYITLENAAVIWLDYLRIPPATKNDVKLSDIAERVGMARHNVKLALRSNEQVRRLRSSQPVGYIADHLDAETAAAVEKRLARVALPPHMLPAMTFDRYINLEYTSIESRLKTGQFNPTKLRLLKGNKVVNCYTWDALAYLEHMTHGKLHENVPDIDFNRLPRDEHDTSPDKIAYAREIQLFFVDPAVIGMDQASHSANMLVDTKTVTGSVKAEVPRIAEPDGQPGRKTNRNEDKIAASQSARAFAYRGLAFKAEVLAAEEEVALARQIEAGLMAEYKLKSQELPRDLRRDLSIVVAEGAAARNRMIESNIGLVRQEARKYYGKGLDQDDLIQEGVFGLVRAIEKFDFTHGIKFSTYATIWINQFIKRAIHNTGRSIRLPVHIGEQLDSVRRASNHLKTIGSPDAHKIEAIAKEANLPPDWVAELLEYSRSIASLDAPIGQDNNPGTLRDVPLSLYDVISDSYDYAEHIAEDDANDPKGILGYLDPVERQAVGLYLGFIGGRTHTYAEIGAIMGLSRRVASSRVQRGLANLRGMYGKSEPVE